MKINNTGNKSKKIFSFAFLYLSTIALLVILFLALLSGNTSKIDIDSKEVHDKILKESDVLLPHLKQLENLDKRYSALFVQAEVTPVMDSVDSQIAQQEYIVNNILDSFEKVKVNYSRKNKTFADKVDSLFRQSLESRRTIGNIRYALAAGNFDFDSTQKKWLKLNSELIAKDDRITALQNQLTLNNFPGQADSSVETQTKVALTGQQKKNADLTSANTLLRQNLKTLTTAYNNLISRGKQKVEVDEKKDYSPNMNDELNAEVQLARISCNLARADVKQIISNSKQRKALLSEALNVLNNLAKSGDPVIQNKAKEKLDELYKISETIRD